MFKMISIIFALLVVSGCGSHRAVAMNEYKQPAETAKLSGATVTITPKMVADSKRRRAKFLKAHTVP